MSGTDYTQTPNLGLYKPIFNRSVGTWGDRWNSNADTLDALFGTGSNAPWLPLSGGTMSGPLAIVAAQDVSNTPLLYANGSFSGTAPSGPAPNWYKFNVANDTVNATAPVGVNWFSFTGSASA